MEQLRDDLVEPGHVAGGTAYLLDQCDVGLDVDGRAVGAHPLLGLLSLYSNGVIRAGASVKLAAANSRVRSPEALGCIQNVPSFFLAPQ